MPPTTISPAERRRLRLLSQGLGAGGVGGAAGAEATPADAVARLFALQGQDLPGALWSIALRVPGTTREQVRGAFDAGELVRTWPFRGTLFALAATDVDWVLRLTGERVWRSAAKRRDALGLDDATFSAARDVAERAIGDRGLSRAALLEAFADAGIAVADGRGYHLLFGLSLQGVIVLGPFDGDDDQRFVLREAWIPRPRRLEGDEALAELVRRYLAGRGPTSDADLAWWTKLPLGTLRRGIDAVRDELTAFDVDGVRHWGHAQSLERVGDESARSTLLLPGFDEYVLGHGDRDPVIAPEHAARIVPGNNGVFKPTVVHRGRVVGLWSRRATARRTTIAAEGLDGPLPPAARRGLDRPARDYARFLGTPVELRD